MAKTRAKIECPDCAKRDVRIRELEAEVARLKKNSSTSSKPPAE